MTPITKQVKKRVDEYVKEVKAAETVLGRLEKEAQELSAVLEDRQATQDEIAATERRIASLQSEREGLKGDYSEALFNADTAEQQRIFRRRNQIDKEVKECDETIRKLRTRLDENPVDAKEVARLQAEIDSFSEPYGLGLVNELRDLLTRDYEIANRLQDLKVGFSVDVDEDTYHQIRMELDGAYASDHRAIQKEAAAFEKREARKQRAVNPFSTPPKVDPRVTAGKAI